MSQAEMVPVPGKPGMFMYAGPRYSHETLRKHPPIPAAWRASTLRLIADHFHPETPEKSVIISPSRQQREEWAEFLRQEADRLDNGSA